MKIEEVNKIVLAAQEEMAKYIGIMPNPRDSEVVRQTLLIVHSKLINSSPS